MIAPAQTENLASLAHLDLEEEILGLKRDMNAVILAHYYQDSEIQDLADFVVDNLQLSQQAASTSADLIVRTNCSGYDEPLSSLEARISHSSDSTKCWRPFR
jgi:quinolinate synthase